LSIKLWDLLRYVKLRGKAIWALGFFSFLSGLNAITAIVLAIDLGIEATFQPYLINSLTGGIQVFVYLLASIIATLVFLGGTASKIISDLSDEYLLTQLLAKTNDLENNQNTQQSLLESLKARVFLVDESVDATKKEMARKFVEQEKEIKQIKTSLVNTMESNLAELEVGVAKQLGDGTKKQGDLLKQFQSSLTSKLENRLENVNETMAKQLASIDGKMQKYSQRVARSTKTVLKQKDEIEEIKLKLCELENQVAKPKPQLTSQSLVEEVRGIGKNTGDELRGIGITNVGELILADAKIIADKTSISEKMAEKLQGRGQLALVPGVTERDTILLEEVDISDRNELANQDVIELGKKINGVFQSFVREGKMTEAERPTIEEINSWIKSAKT
jgi:hypothetical protein